MHANKAPGGCPPAGNIVCRPKRSGNTPVGLERRQRIISVTIQRRIGCRSMLGAVLTRMAAHSLWAAGRQIVGDFTTCTETSKNGVRIGFTPSQAEMSLTPRGRPQALSRFRGAGLGIVPTADQTVAIIISCIPPLTASTRAIPAPGPLLSAFALSLLRRPRDYNTLTR